MMNEAGYSVSLYGPEATDKDNLTKCKQENQLDFEKFFSAVFETQKERILRTSTLHILNSRSEGYPMAVLESMNLYTPQILSRGTNLLEDLKEWDFGLEFDEKIVETLSMLSFQAYIKLAENAKAYAELHDLEVIGKQSLVLYK